MGALASGLQSAGQAASDFGQAKFDFSNWQQQQRANRLNEIIQGVRLQQIQQQLKQAQLPQPYGTVRGQGGSELGVTYDPVKGAYSTQQLTPGFNAGAIGAAVDSTIATLPEQFRPFAQKLYASYAAMGDPAGGLKAITSIGEREEVQALKAPKIQKPPKINYEPGTGLPVSIDDGLGNTFDVNDPNLPANLKALKASALGAHSQHLREQEQTEVRRGAEQLDRASQLMKMREDQKIQGDAIKASQVAREAKIGLDTAKQHAARKESYSDLSLIYTAVRSNVQGAGRMTQTEILQALSAGSFGDVWKRRYEGATKGTLPDEDRQKILHEVEDAYWAKRQAGEQAWEQGFPDKVMPPWLRKSPEEEMSGYAPKK